jgi:hypothetical protein
VDRFSSPVQFTDRSGQQLRRVLQMAQAIEQLSDSLQPTPARPVSGGRSPASAGASGTTTPDRAAALAAAAAASAMSASTLLQVRPPVLQPCHALPRGTAAHWLQRAVQALGPAPMESHFTSLGSGPRSPRPNRAPHGADDADMAAGAAADPVAADLQRPRRRPRGLKRFLLRNLEEPDVTSLLSSLGISSLLPSEYPSPP